jgi:hypothetical protein
VGNTPDAVVQIVHQFDNNVGNASYAVNGVRAITGLQAFRSYGWMTDAAALNSVGNFRGMVVSARWATAYTVVSPAAKILGNLATMASLASNIMQMAPQFEQVYQSKGNMIDKAQKYSLLTSIVAQKTLMGTITGGVHLIYLPLLYGCGAAAGAAGDGPVASAAYVCAQVVQSADALVQNSANYLTDPANQQKVLMNLVTINIAQ